MSLFRDKAPKVEIAPTQTKLPFGSGVKKKPEPNPTNWQFAKLKACKAMTQEKLPTQASIKAKFGPVYSQIYGSCTSNAVLACDAYYYHTEKWSPSAVFTYYNQHVLEKDTSGEDNGSTVEMGLDAVRKYGACNAKVWPNTKPYNKKPSKKAYKNGLKGHELTNYYNVKSLLQIKKAICKGYPVAFAADWAFTSVDPKTWILNDPTDKEIENCTAGHAMVIVGYDDTTELFEIRNSWGTGWANKGYAYISYSTLKKVIWFDDTYAVVK